MRNIRRKIFEPGGIVASKQAMIMDDEPAKDWVCLVCALAHRSPRVDRLKSEAAVKYHPTFEVFLTTRS